MIPSLTAATRPLRPLLIVSALAALVPAGFSGCFGGTSTEADNPSLTLEFREGGKAASISGVIMVYAKNSNPVFLNPDPDDGGNPPQGGEGRETAIADLGFPETHSLTLDLKLIQSSLRRHPILTLAKTSAAAQADTLPDFNLVLVGSGGKMALLSGIHLARNPARFVTEDGGPAGSQIMQVDPERDYSGTVDTTTDAGKPLALFVPGTYFYAKVRNGRFTFEGLPSVKMPLRWVSSNGIVRAMLDSLGQTWTQPLKPGERVDSIAMPKPMVDVQLPAATPPGHYAFTDSVAVSLASESGASIYYTMDGSTPDIGSTLYKAPLILRSSATLKSVAYIKGRNHSAVSVNNYTLVPSQPMALPTGSAFRDSLVVSITSPYPGATLYYTLDGSAPGTSSTVYDRPIVLTASATLKALADVSGLGQSRVLEEKYILVSDSLALGD